MLEKQIAVPYNKVMELLFGPRAVEADLASQFIHRPRFLPAVTEAYKYAVESDLYVKFYGNAEFSPKMMNYWTGNRFKPVLTMSTVTEDGVMLEVAAIEVESVGGIRGFCEVSQDTPNGFCAVCIFISHGKPVYAQVVIEGIDAKGKPLTVPLVFNSEYESLDRPDIVKIFKRLGYHRDISNKINIEGFERLMKQIANGLVSTSGNVTVEEIVARVGDLLAQG